MIKHELVLFGVEVSASSTRPNNKTSSREAPAKILTSKMCLDARGEGREGSSITGNEMVQPMILQLLRFNWYSSNEHNLTRLSHNN